MNFICINCWRNVLLTTRTTISRTPLCLTSGTRIVATKIIDALTKFSRFEGKLLRVVIHFLMITYCFSTLIRTVYGKVDDVMVEIPRRKYTKLERGKVLIFASFIRKYSAKMTNRYMRNQ